MNIAEIKKLKEEAEETIAEALENFEAKSKMTVEGVSFQRISKDGSIIGVELSVKL